jgi:hypothetical protein
MTTLAKEPLAAHWKGDPTELLRGWVGAGGRRARGNLRGFGFGFLSLRGRW